MCRMILVRLPFLLAVELTTKWLEVEDSCKLDSAVSNHPIRSRFLALLSSQDAVYPASRHIFKNKELSYFSWIIKREMTIWKLIIVDIHCDDIYHTIELFRETKTGRGIRCVRLLNRCQLFTLTLCIMKDTFPNLTGLSIESEVSFSVENNCVMENISLPNLMKLKVSWMDKEHGLDQFLRCLLLYSSTLEELSLSQIEGEFPDAEIIEFFETRSQFLKSFQLAMTTAPSASIFYAMANSNCSSLTSLVLSRLALTPDAAEALTQCAKSCLQLTKLVFSHNEYVDDDCMSEFAKHCHLLKHVNTENCRDLTEISMLPLVKNCLLLETLVVSHTHVSYAVIHTVLKQCVNIQSIHAASAWCVVDDIGADGEPLLALTEPRVKLTILDLSECNKLTDSVLLNLSTVVPNLLSFAITSPFVTDSGLEYILKACPKLTSISLSRCAMLTDVTVHNLATLTDPKSVDITGCPKMTRSTVFANLFLKGSKMTHLLLDSDD